MALLEQWAIPQAAYFILKSFFLKFLFIRVRFRVSSVIVSFSFSVCKAGADPRGSSPSYMDRLHDNFNIKTP